MRRSCGLVVALALLVAGCGGGSSHRPSGSLLSKPQLAARADAICRQAAKDLNAVPPLTDVRDAAGVARYFAAAKPIAERQDARLKALRPAAALKPAYDAFLAQTGRATRLLAATYAAAKAGRSLQGAALLRRLAASIAATNRAAASLGLKACGGS